MDLTYRRPTDETILACFRAPTLGQQVAYFAATAARYGTGVADPVPVEFVRSTPTDWTTEELSLRLNVCV